VAKLKLNPEPTFKAKVLVPVPGAAPAPVEFTFKYRTRSELREYVQSLADLPENADEVQTFKAFVAGWDLDDPFTDENIARLLDAYPGAGSELSNTYLRESFGARRGN